MTSILRGTDRCIYNNQFIENLKEYISDLSDEVGQVSSSGMTYNRFKIVSESRIIAMNQIIEQYSIFYKYINKPSIFGSNAGFSYTNGKPYNAIQPNSNYIDNKLEPLVNNVLNNIINIITELNNNNIVSIPRDEMYTNPLSKFKVIDDIEKMKRIYCSSHKKRVYNGGKKTRKGRKHRKTTRRR